MMGHGFDLLSYERFEVKFILSEIKGSSRPCLINCGTAVVVFALFALGPAPTQPRPAYGCGPTQPTTVIS